MAWHSSDIWFWGVCSSGGSGVGFVVYGFRLQGLGRGLDGLGYWPCASGFGGVQGLEMTEHVPRFSVGTSWDSGV